MLHQNHSDRRRDLALSLQHFYTFYVVRAGHKKAIPINKSGADSIEVCGRTQLFFSGVDQVNFIFLSS